MADAIVSTAADSGMRVMGLVEEQSRYNVNLIRGAEQEVLSFANDLQNVRMGGVNVTMRDAKNLERFSHSYFSRWLSRLEQTTYEFDYVLDEWDYAIRKLQISGVVAPPKKKVCSFIPSSSCLGFKEKVVHRDNFAKKLLNVKAQIDEILETGDQYGFVIVQPTVDRFPGPLRVQSTPFIELEQVHGRDTPIIESEQVHGRDMDRDILVSKLMDNSCSMQEELGLRVVSIVGMAGLGKTTLAHLVYNHSQIKKYFQLRRWVCVSETFDLVAIFKGILGSSSPNSDDPDVLSRMVLESIFWKRFLLVFDDVWTEDYIKWEPLEAILRYGGAGSRVLVTTRSRRVVPMMWSKDSDIHQLGMLSDEDCWLILCRRVFSGRNIEVKFEDIGKKIAQKSKGLPISAKIFGGLLYSKSSLEEWENVLRGEIWQMEEAEVYFSPLFLSYKDLSPMLKRCFSYCVVFPKDTEIIVENLIQNWMALGYLGSDVGNMELKGRECFNVLAMRSLFHDFEKDVTDEIQSCKMHDMVHDFAKYLKKRGRVVEEARMNESPTCQTCDPSQVSNLNAFFTLCCNEETPPNICKCLVRLRVLDFTNCGLKGIPNGIENLIHLRRLSLTGITEISHEDLKIIFQLYGLQTLSLRKCGLKEIPKEIGNLIRLRGLDLSWNESLKELPEEVGELIQLRHLHLNSNKSLEKLPESIGYLQQLQTLNILGCKRICRLPRGVADLIGLRTLNEFRGGGGNYNNFRLLKNLNDLGGVLWLRIKLDGSFIFEDAQAAKLSNKTRIRELRIYFEEETSSESSSVSFNVLRALEPHSKLRELSIWNYWGSSLPPWMVFTTQVRNLNLHFCKHLTSLPAFGKLPCLEELCIDAMEALQTVGREFLGITIAEGGSGGDVIAFHKLKTLEFRDCGEWKEWEDITEGEESAATSVMPCLTKLTITGCNGLALLPHRLLHKASSLNKLCISGSKELVRRYEKNSIPINNPRLHLICYS